MEGSEPVRDGEPRKAGGEEASATRPGSASRASLLAAAGVFAVCLAVAYAGFGPSHWREDVPLPSALVKAPDAPGPAVKPVVRSDYRLAVWAVARNARVLATRPLRLFDAEPCHPAPRSLALHHPLIAPALLAMPFALATGDAPVLTFNLMLLASALVSAAAMFLLVRDWTGSSAAATTAAVLYAFHVSQLGRPQHFFTVDNAWMLFGLYFGRRLLVEGRWTDAWGLAAACALQASASFYPLLAALALGLPMAVYFAWLVRGRPAAPARLAISLGLAAAGAAAVLVPYVLQGGTLAHRSNVFYAPWSRFAPGGELFPGVVCGVLAVAGLFAARRRAMPGLASDPRPALVVGLVLVAWLATGGNAAAWLAALYGAERPSVVLPNAFAWLRAVLPGLESVRLPSAIGGAVVPIVALVAGFGAAALLRRVPRRLRTAAGVGLVALACIDTLWPAAGGFAHAVRYVPLAMRPDDATLAFYAGLRRRADAGALLELPLDRRDKDYVFNRAAEEHLLSAYHHMRTSGCYSSFIPREVRDLDRLQHLERPAVRAALREEGFGTVVVHHPPGRPALARFAARVERAAEGSGGGLRPVARAPFATAYALDPPASPPDRAGPPASAPDRAGPPVVLVVVDTLRADRVGSYGNARPTTPNIDALAADAVRFEAARSQAPWTTPSVAALLASRYPSDLGIRDIGDPVPPDTTWLPAALRRAGYATGAVVSHSFVAERWGFDRGFDAFDSSPVAGQRAVTSDAVTDAAIAFVDAHADEPFFLFAHYFDPHFALIDHPEFGFRDPGPPYVGRVRSPVPFLVFGRADAGVTPREAREMLRIYDSEVAYTDRQVGRLLDHLRARGLYDPAMIVLTADHGEEYLDHGRIGHTKTLFDELLRVPLILKVPGVPPRVEPGPVALVDVFPTLVDALGLSAPEGLVGRSLLEPPDPERPIYAETSRQARLRSVVVGREKLVRDLASRRDRLFDLRDDPAERRDLAAARPDRTAALERLLGAWQARHGRARPALPPVRVDPAERERLRALGYGE